MVSIGFSEGRGSVSAVKNIGISESKRSSSVRKISSSLRIEKTSDAVADSAIGTKLKMKMQSISQVLISATQINSTLDVADSALSNIINALERMKVLSIQANSTQLTSSDRDKVNTEFHALREEIDRIAKSTEFNNRRLLSGSRQIEMDQFGYDDPSDPDDISLRLGFLSQDNVFGGGIQSITYDTDSTSDAMKFEYDADTKKFTITSINSGASEYVLLSNNDIEEGKTEKIRFHRMRVNVSLNSFFDKTKSMGEKYSDKLSLINENNNLLNVNYSVNDGAAKFSLNPSILKTPVIDEETGKYVGVDGSFYSLDTTTFPATPDFIDYDTGALLTWDNINSKYINKQNATHANIIIRMEENERSLVPLQNIDGSYRIVDSNEPFNFNNNHYVADDGFVYSKGGGVDGTSVGNKNVFGDNGIYIKIDVEVDTAKSSYKFKNGVETRLDVGGGAFTFDPLNHVIDKDGFVYSNLDLLTRLQDDAATDVQYDVEIDNTIYKPQGNAITRLDTGSTSLTMLEFTNNNYSVDKDGFISNISGKKLQNQSPVRVRMKEILQKAPYVSSTKGKVTDLKSFDIKVNGTYGKAKFYIEGEDGVFESEEVYNLTNNQHNKSAGVDDGLSENRLAQGEHEILFKRFVKDKGVDRVDTFSVKFEVYENSDIDFNKANESINDSKFLTLNELKNTVVTYQNQSDTLSLLFKVGASDEDFDKIIVDIESVTSQRLNMDTEDFDLKEEKNVANTQERLDAIIEEVLMRISNIAITQNRIEKTIDNINNVVKNSQIAVSSIFDLDIPSEMVVLSQYELQQSAAIETLSRELKAKQNLLKLF